MENTKDLRKLRLGEILIDRNVITPGQLEAALNAKKGTSRKLGQILMDLGFVTENQILKAISEQLEIPIVDLEDYPIDIASARLISEDWARKYSVLALGREEGRLVLAMADPLDFTAVDTIHLFTDTDVKTVIANSSDLDKAIGRVYRDISVERALGAIENQSLAGAGGDTGSDSEVDANAPVIRLFNNLLSKAVTLGASDIHFEPYERVARVRFRVDGLLREELTLNKVTFEALVSRIKVAANLNTVEKRLPQDGRINMTINKSVVDLRISTLPTYLGEKVVLRILNQSQMLLSLTDLGFDEGTLERFSGLIRSPHGIILVTGPTGSGKTTTLYAVLHSLNDEVVNIMTVENPVEYKLFGINQIQVNEALGLSFSTVLRSILRQDPDVIMVGEIRDTETASIATRAAATGHLVLSTLHTNDSIATVSRLLDMGIAPYLIADSVRGVLSQRLVRKICRFCKISYPAPAAEARLLGVAEGTLLHRGEGCPHCGQTGYSGRTGVYELLIMDRKLRTAVEERASSQVLEELAVENGLVKLADSCRKLVLDGVTTVQEFGKITFRF